MNYFIIFFIIFFNISTYLGNLFAEKETEEEIVILVSSTNTIFSKGVTGFESSFYKKSKVVYLSEILQKGENGADFFSEYEDKNLPFMVTFGIEATQLASTALKKTPIIHSFVQASRTLYNGQNKMCGLDLKPSLKDYYSALKEMKPNANKVVTFYSTTLGEYSAKETEYEDIFHGLYSTSMQVTSSEEFSRSLENLDEDIAGFMMVADPIYDRKNFEILSEFCKKRGIVLMTIYPALVDIGATFAIVPDYTSVGEQTARFAIDVYEGKIECNMGPIVIPTGQILYFNEDYALSSGFKLSEQFQKRVNEDELLTLALELYYKKMYQSSKKAFEKILDKNPSHVLAKQYLSQLKYRLTKDETQKLTKIGDENFQKKNYSLASEYYSKVLRLNPDLKEIRQKLDKSIQLESEEKRQQANTAYKNGNSFLAARKYLEAIRILPSNSGAKNDLENLRRKEKTTLPAYYKKAMDFYNNRNYEDSIIAFDNILLIDPVDERAQEYLRLSKIKKEAMERLERCKKEGKSGCELLK